MPRRRSKTKAHQTLSSIKRATPFTALIQQVNDHLDQETDRQVNTVLARSGIARNNVDQDLAALESQKNGDLKIRKCIDELGRINKASTMGANEMANDLKQECQKQAARTAENRKRLMMEQCWAFMKTGEKSVRNAIGLPPKAWKPWRGLFDNIPAYKNLRLPFELDKPMALQRTWSETSEEYGNRIDTSLLQQPEETDEHFLERSYSHPGDLPETTSYPSDYSLFEEEVSDTEKHPLTFQGPASTESRSNLFEPYSALSRRPTMPAPVAQMTSDPMCIDPAPLSNKSISDLNAGSTQKTNAQTQMPTLSTQSLMPARSTSVRLAIQRSTRERRNTSPSPLYSPLSPQSTLNEKMISSPPRSSGMAHLEPKPPTSKLTLPIAGAIASGVIPTPVAALGTETLRSVASGVVVIPAAAKTPALAPAPVSTAATSSRIAAAKSAVNKTPTSARKLKASAPKASPAKARKKRKADDQDPSGPRKR